MPVRSVCLLAICVCAAAAACSKTPESARPSDANAAASGNKPRSNLHPVSAPDVSGAEAGLRERVQVRYASLVAVRDDRAASDADLAAAFAEVGKLLMAAEFLNEAEPFLANAEMLAPQAMAWPYYRGHLHRLRGQAEAAAQAFERARALDPDHVPVLVWLGLLHLDAGRIAAAGPLLDRAVAEAPHSVAARLARGRAALAAGDHSLAIEHLEAALAVDAAALPVHYPLAMAYRGLGDHARAADHLRQWKQGEVHPDDALMREIGESLDTAVAYETRGTRALDARRWAEAAALFRKGLEVAPRDATLHQNLGTALYLGGDTAGALAAFREALRLSPGYAKAHFSIGVLMDASGRDDEAVARLSDAVRYDPQMVEARFSLADALRRTGQLEAALAHYQTIVAADAGASQARFGQAMALVRLGRYAQARAVLEEAAVAHPDQPGLPHALARVLAAAPEDGVRDGARALAIAQALHAKYGANPALLETLAMALAEVGRFRDARARQQDAIAAATAQRLDDLLPAMRERLGAYEAGRPSRKPWRDDDPVHRPRAVAALK